MDATHEQEWDSAPLTGEAVDARGDGALVGQVPGDAALVLGGSASDEGGVEDEAVLGGVSSGLEGSGWGWGGGTRLVSQSKLTGPKELIQINYFTSTDKTGRGLF